MGLEIKARYLGGGVEFIPGIPTRDLTVDDWLKLPADLQKKAISTKVYKLVKPPKQEKEEPKESD